ncbi:hypothetical protein L3Y34_009752 [Caenorhabditis briggsae]|uniref:Uncharacterized protein n=1 Tax=Caenorhabditis briggsae TaxID=6238 RepID=A0AAE9A3D5_CAEBR|nr:hypothetical protein L3Y34_009752 [Caenorhabditis briggsae]
MLNIVFPTIPEVLELIYQLIRLIVLAIAMLSLFFPIIVTPIYISVFRSNRQRDQATPVYPITHYFYKMTYHTSLNCIVISSALLYIPILISIFRLRHLPSIEKHKPHKYILYQTIILVFYKIVEAVTVSILKTDNNLLVSSVTDIFVTQFCELNEDTRCLAHALNQVAIAYIQSTNV